jgi:hypothetical protein
MVRTLGVIASVVAVVSGVTFAALQSQQVKFTGNTIETATANLSLSSDGVNFSATQTGFDFSNIVPGGQPVPQSGYSIYLKNGGGTPLALKLAVSTTPSNPNNVDLNKVNVVLTPVGSGSPQTFTLQSLITANTTGGVAITTPSELFVGNTTHFTLQVSMATDAITGSGASLGNIDFAFNGLALSN